jgi:hypothetical protein
VNPNSSDKNEWKIKRQTFSEAKEAKAFFKTSLLRFFGKKFASLSLITE